ncbi:hypothetical protein M9H77_19411 [Catharanthus roseus]|uniref:Uncharacterized protein n=1 Tax=Catharanthus roseus TaxID=4058 RepID=A0ACC0BAA4_CATRO|nr:hypothetical protein M9H77_19411 [Catharanthus roseus]
MTATDGRRSQRLRLMEEPQRQRLMIKTIATASDDKDHSDRWWKTTNFSQSTPSFGIVKMEMRGKYGKDEDSMGFRDIGVIIFLFLGMGEGTSIPRNSKAWRRIWELNVQPRVRVFLWHLVRRRLGISPGHCCRCGAKEENDRHVLLECPITSRAWRVHNRYSASLKIEMVEFPAVLLGVRLGLRLEATCGVGNFVIESDCLNMVN